MPSQYCSYVFFSSTSLTVELERAVFIRSKIFACRSAFAFSINFGN